MQRGNKQNDGRPEKRVSPSVTRRGLTQQLMETAKQQSGMLFVVDGAAGMGKTFLLRGIAEAAIADQEWRTTFLRADEIEHLEPYSFIERLVASNLVTDWYLTPDAYTNPVELARECVRRLTGSGDTAGSVIVIDDAQWIDDASQRVLRYVIPRVVRRRTLLAFGTRTPHASESFGEFLLNLGADSPLDTVHHLRPLTVSEISALVLERHGARISAQSAQRILDATGGTFLGVDSVLATLSEREVAQLHLSWETEIKVTLQDDIPLLHSFKQLNAEAQRTCELVCLAGHELTTHQLRQAVELLGEPLVLDPGIDADVLSESGYNEIILPRHALLAEAVAGTVSAERARQVFRALAGATTGHRSMRHRIRGAEVWNAELHALVDAYVQSEAAQGHLINASEILREALVRVSAPDERAKLLTDLALVHMEAKTSYLVLDILDELDQFPKSVLNEMLCIVLAAHRIGHDFPQERVQQLLMTRPQSVDEQVILAHFAFMVVILSMRGTDYAAVPPIIALAKAFTEQLPKDAAAVSNPRIGWMVEPVAQTVVLDCYQLVYAQRMADSATVTQMLPGLVERALDLADSAHKVDALVAIAGAEVSIGHISSARAHAQQAVDMLDYVGLPWAAGTARVILIDCMIAQGEFLAANDYLDLVEEFAYATMDLEVRPAFAALRERIAAITREDDWASHAAQAKRQRAFNWEGYEPALNLVADCEASRVSGDIAGVLAASEGEWVERLDNTRHGFLTYRANALIDSGQLDEAATLIHQLGQWRGTRWLECWGSLDWLHARLAQAQGEHETALWHYASAVENDEYPLPLSLARADYGELLLQLGKADAASEQLSAALHELERIGAHGYTPGVREQLTRVNSQSATRFDASALDVLTERERQVVMHLARGRSNSQIAESLVVSVTTVRTHVSNVLRKLMLSSRGEIAKLLRDYTPETERRLEI